MTAPPSAVGQAEHVRSGAMTARELVEASLATIAERDGDVNAFVALAAERALAEADGIRPGDPRPLCGVPVAIKDFLTATAGLPTMEGSRAFGDRVAAHDSAHVRRLRAAGAIVLGRTSSPELALRPVTTSARFGVTRNPRDLTRAAGGSSGGSAAAVAAGMVALADGSDFAGSIRIPAACCGVLGLKPSRGRVSMAPDLGDVGAGHMAFGVLGRTALDVAVALDAIAGAEPGDHHVAPPPRGRFADAVRRGPGRVRVRVALRAPLGVPVDAEPAAAARRTADALAVLDHDVLEDPPDWDDEDLPAAWATFTGAVVQHVLRVATRLHGGRCDPDLLEPATRASAAEAPPVPAADLLEAVEHLRALSRRLLRAWAHDDVLLTPTLTRLPPAANAVPARAGVSDDAVRLSAFVRLWNVTGQPAVSVPLHATAAGLPVGVQLVGPPGRDDLVLALAAQLEAAQGP